MQIKQYKSKLVDNKKVRFNMIVAYSFQKNNKIVCRIDYISERELTEDNDFIIRHVKIPDIDSEWENNAMLGTTSRHLYKVNSVTFEGGVIK